MFWDRVAWVYDLFANHINRRANEALCAAVAEELRPEDEVLECACGTGLLSGVISERCRSLVATDLSENMLKVARRKFGGRPNLTFRQGDILRIDFPDESFDAVVAANVIHLLKEPCRALAELDRVCRKGGRILLPTYMNETESGGSNPVSGAIGRAGADFQRAFTPESYQDFLTDAGYPDVRLTLCQGRIPCALAVIRKGGRSDAL